MTCMDEAARRNLGCKEYMRQGWASWEEVAAGREGKGLREEGVHVLAGADREGTGRRKLRSTRAGGTALLSWEPAQVELATPALPGAHSVPPGFLAPGP